MTDNMIFVQSLSAARLGSSSVDCAHKMMPINGDVRTARQNMHELTIYMITPTVHKKLKPHHRIKSKYKVATVAKVIYLAWPRR
jgi:hypothetical protein